MEKIQVPVKVQKIIAVLQENGYEAYAVGGCVRDTILGRKPEDWDITTSAKPEQVKALFHRTIDTGIAHGTVTVMLDKEGFEVTTYRVDGEYEDCRHPKEVEFTNNLEMDLERRDFTINAMAYNDSTGIVDVYGGLEDIESKTIRCVREAKLRFSEDALRILRAVRFAGQLGFSIEDKTREAVKELAPNLQHISAERIRVELTKLLISPGAGKIRDAYQLGITAVVLPEFDAMMEVHQKNPHHIYTVGEHTIKSIECMNVFFGVCNDPSLTKFVRETLGEETFERVRKQCEEYDKKIHVMLVFTMLLHDIAKPSCMTVDEEGKGHFYGHPAEGKPMAIEILQRLKFDNETIHTVAELVYWHDHPVEPGRRSVRRAASKIGKEIVPLLFLVKRADTLAQNPETFAEKFSKVEMSEKIFQEIVEAGECLRIKDLAVNGSDLISAGVKPGPQMGALLEQMLEHVLENPEDNDKKILLEKFL